MTTETIEFDPDLAASAGDLLLVRLEQLSMSQSDLAARTGLSGKHINQLIKHGVAVSPHVANSLELATGVAAEIWAAVDAAFQARRARAGVDERLEESLEWLDQFNLGELHARGVLSSPSRGVQASRDLLKFFGISEPAAWGRVWMAGGATFRRSPAFAPSPAATTVWLRTGQRAASEVETRPYSADTLSGMIEELRAMTRLEIPEAVDQIRASLARAGVALVLAGEFAGCRASGASWWAGPAKAVVLLSHRGKREDRLWFTLFHELGHVLKHAKRDTFLDQHPDDASAESEPFSDWTVASVESRFLDDGSRAGLLEEEADRFAADSLIPPRFVPAASAATSEAEINQIAAEIGVSAGVVAGRWQFEHGDYARFTRLRRNVPGSLFDD